jgi:oligopeptide/dipeptide ABC transporter ATP-binding protein
MTSVTPTTNRFLVAQDLSKFFPIRGGVFSTLKGEIKAVDKVSFFVNKGETLGIVGESGCGKTTLARLIMRLVEPSGGRVVFMGGELLKYSPEKMQEARQHMQMVFQDPLSALDPRMTIKNIIGEPMVVYGIARGENLTQKVTELLEVVGLKKEHLNRYPHEFSGGQRQRINIARALALRPSMLFLDEPTSALDVSVQAKILNLLMDLQRELGLTYVFITHNLGVVFHISDRVAVMYAGKLVELGKTETIFLRPSHPYTKALLSAVAVADPTVKIERITLTGEVPSPAKPPPGCRFHPRCWQRAAECSEKEPLFLEIEPEHFVACYHPLERGRT